MTNIDNTIRIPYDDYRYIDDNEQPQKIKLFLTDFIFEVINSGELISFSNSSSLDSSSPEKLKFSKAYFFISENYAVKFREVAQQEEANFSSIYDKKQLSLIISLLISFVVLFSMIAVTVFILMYIYSSIYSRILEVVELFRLLDSIIIENFILQCKEFNDKFITEQKYQRWDKNMALANNQDFEEYDEFDEIMKKKEQEEFILQAALKTKEFITSKFPLVKPQTEAVPNTPGRLFSEFSKRDPKAGNLAFEKESSERQMIQSNAFKRQSTVQGSKTLAQRRASKQYQQVNPIEEEEDNSKEKLIYKKTYVREVLKRIFFAGLMWFPLTAYTLYRDYVNYLQHEAAISQLKSSLEVKISANHLNAFSFSLVLSNQSSLINIGSEG